MRQQVPHPEGLLLVDTPRHSSMLLSLVQLVQLKTSQEEGGKLEGISLEGMAGNRMAHKFKKYGVVRYI